jgi:hypothetical protein
MRGDYRPVWHRRGMAEPIVGGLAELRRQRHMKQGLDVLDGRERPLDCETWLQQA